MLVVNLNKTSEYLQKIFDHQNQENLTVFLENMSAASSGFNELIQHVDATRGSMDVLLSNINNIAGNINYTFENNSEKLNASFTDLLSIHIDTITHHLESSSRNFHEFSRQIKENLSSSIHCSPQIDQAEE